MKRLLFSICLCGLILLGMTAAQAKTYTFTPKPADLGDLEHSYYYSWNINWAVPKGEIISDAVLTFTNINNWKDEPNDNWLYIHLLDSPPTNGTRLTTGGNVWRWSDTDGGGDNWAGKGPLVATYIDKSPVSENLSYTFSKLNLVGDLRKCAADGKFGLGFDPDCHYYNDGAELDIVTVPVPEPGTALALGSGLISLAAYAFRRRCTPK